MILLKTSKEISIIKEGGEILSKVHGEISKKIDVGVTTLSLDVLAENIIKSYNAYPSFKNFKGYKYSICVSVNEVVVHGLPSEYVIKDGDIVSIDCGVYYRGYHTDSAYTYCIGNVDNKYRQLVEITKKVLEKAIKFVNKTKSTGDLGFMIQNYIESKGYSVIRDLVGHGVGRSLHEDPEIPNFGRPNTGVKFRDGMVFAVEPMVSFGKHKLLDDVDGWSLYTKDKSPSAHFEHTLGLIDGKVNMLTSFEYIDNNSTYA